MSIIPASCLSSSDLALLGNNVIPARRHRRRLRTSTDTANRRVLAAVQRSLASVGESVTALYSTPAPVGGHRGR